MVLDKDLVSTLAQILETINGVVPLVMDFIQYGGVELLERALKVHEDDDYVKITLPKLVKSIIGRYLWTLLYPNRPS